MHECQTLKMGKYLNRRWNGETIVYQRKRNCEVVSTSWRKDEIENEVGKCLSFYRLIQRRLTTFEEANYDNHIPGSVYLTITGKYFNFINIHFYFISFTHK